MAAESYIQNLIADRIGGSMFGKDTKIYKFEKIKRAKKAAMKEHPGVELIDMGVGEPDGMAFPGVVNAVSPEAFYKAINHVAPSFIGAVEFYRTPQNTRRSKTTDIECRIAACNNAGKEQ